MSSNPLLDQVREIELRSPDRKTFLNDVVAALSRTAARMGSSLTIDQLEDALVVACPNLADRHSLMRRIVFHYEYTNRRLWEYVPGDGYAPKGAVIWN